MGSTSTTPSGSYTLRSHRPGDMGWITHRHGVLYEKEYGWGQAIEPIVGRITADFLDQHDPEKERCWIAERDGEFLGCIMLVKDKAAKDNAAKLRVLLVEPAARGLGLGAVLIDQCTRFAKEVGYSRITLWTQSVLLSARRQYERAGYRLVASEEDGTLGEGLVGECWELVL
ncbi:GNAT family N-acetyltransferase [Aspergillus steynii IBT 23096]|uniref:GNAT family N-acetyltransferase n=1 Tax=Aspergillus steynii IBT 23096 TaxID=1392250 RepID=A0A2I2GA33_9EURO|nr:GNAT family N-acetyltransferase [Aspergillus steynii IBT 23096]PLB49737.1 GNAT family N-acetyltransferase [Aspergillus steynii IBT 23096]